MIQASAAIFEEHPTKSALSCLGVLMPVYNEAATLHVVLARVLGQPCVEEVVAVDDGSKDNSWEILQERASQDQRMLVLRHDRNRGKGAAIRTALASAHAPIVIIQDADLEYDPADYGWLVQPIVTGETQVVYGSRFASGSDCTAEWWHAWTNHLLTTAANLMTGLRLTDEATCYKAFRKEVLLRLALEEDGFGFCPEVTAKLAREGECILEVPVRYIARSRAQGKKLRWRHGFEALWCLWRYSQRSGKIKP